MARTRNQHVCARARARMRAGEPRSSPRTWKRRLGCAPTGARASESVRATVRMPARAFSESLGLVGVKRQRMGEGKLAAGARQRGAGRKLAVLALAAAAAPSQRPASSDQGHAARKSNPSSLEGRARRGRTRPGPQRPRGGGPRVCAEHDWGTVTAAAGTQTAPRPRPAHIAPPRRRPSPKPVPANPPPAAACAPPPPPVPPRQLGKGGDSRRRDPRATGPWRRGHGSVRRTARVAAERSEVTCRPSQRRLRPPARR